MNQNWSSREVKVKRIGTLLVVFGLGVFAVKAAIVNLGASAHASQSQVLTAGLIPYDNFDEHFLNPTKWSLFGLCYNFSALECVREIQDDRLRLAVRNYGQTTSNEGNQFEPAELHFTNPSSIKTIAAEFVVRRTSSMGCPANTVGLPNAHAHTLLAGNFFNSGSGNSADDLQGFLAFDHQTLDPENVLTVGAFLMWEGQLFGFVDMGTTLVGKEVVAELSWDQPHSQLIARWTDPETGKVTKALLPYTMPDTTPAASPDKFIGVRTFAPNCIGSQMLLSDMESSFDKVWIGK
jgi:hypothetical protein